MYKLVFKYISTLIFPLVTHSFFKSVRWTYSIQAASPADEHHIVPAHKELKGREGNRWLGCVGAKKEDAEVEGSAFVDVCWRLVREGFLGDVMAAAACICAVLEG